MSEETQETQESTWTGLKKTIIGTLATVVTAGGAWIGTTLFGGEEAAPAPVQAAPTINITQQAAPAAAAPVNNTTIIHEKTVEKAAPAPKEEVKKEESPW
jgi:hypothetical protein